MLVPTEVTPPRHQQHKPLVEARRAQIAHHRDLQDREYASLNEENRNLRDDVRDLDRIIKLLKEEQRRLQKELLEKNKDNDWLRTLLAEQTAKVKEFEKDQVNLRNQLDEAKAQVNELTSAVKARDDTIEGLKQDLMSSMKAHQDALEEIAQRDAQIKNFKVEVEDLKKQRDAVEEEKEQLNSKIRGLEQSLEEFGSRADDFERRLKASQEEATNALTRCEALKAKITNMKTMDEDGWSGSEDSDGMPKRRKKKEPMKAVRPPTPEVVIDTAQIDELKALVEKLTSDLHAERARADQAETDAEARKVEGGKHLTELRSAEERIASLSREVDELSKVKTVLFKTQSELAAERAQREAITTELSQCHTEIERLTAIAESCEDLAIQIQHFREQRRVAEEFSARMLQEYAAKVTAAEAQMKRAEEERDDAVALASDKAKLATQKADEVVVLQQQLETSKQSTRLAEQRVAALSKQIQGLQDDVVKERLAKAESDAQKAYLAHEGTNVIDALKLAQSEIARLQRDLDTCQVHLSDVQAALQDSEHFRQQVTESANANMTALTNENDALKATVAALQQQRDGVLCRDPAHADFDTLRQDAVAAMQHLQTVIQEQASDKRRLAELEAHFANATQRAAQLEALLGAAQSQLDAERAAQASTGQQAQQINALRDELAAKDAATKKAKLDLESRLEKERADWSTKLRLSEAKRTELEASLQAKIALVKQHQDAIIGHEKKLNDAVAAAVADQRQAELRLRRELAAAQDELAAERNKRTDAERVASEAKSREAATRREADALKETQMHW